MSRITTYILILSFLIACGSEVKVDRKDSSTTVLEKSIPNDKLYGVWEGVTFQVSLNSVDNIEDSTAVFEVSEAAWEAKLQVKPVRTIYLPDSTYVQEFRTLQGEIYNTTKGLWNTYGDTIMLLERDATYTYDSKFNDKGWLELRSLVDWDDDGQLDDEYLATHRLVGRDVRAYQ